jgi:lipopolysaccharide transport system permease protein
MSTIEELGLAGARPQEALQVRRVEATHGRFPLNLPELWRYRELLYFLIWRDIKVRYKQAALGATWAIIQPVTSMIIFSVIFGHLAGISPEYHVPYPLFVFAGLLPWLYFSSSLAQSSTSVVGNSNLVTKVYFPRLLIPLASIVVPVIDFMIAFCVLIAMFLWYGRLPHWHAIVTPVFLGMALLTALGVGLWLSALNVRYRDVPYAVPFLTQIWLYASPVIYGVTLVPARWRWLLALNPMTGVIDGFRWAVLGRGLPQYHVYAISALVGAVLTFSGLWYFRHVERHFADVI